MEIYDTMGQEDLLKKLERVVRTSFDKKEYPPYALTVDNFLKMSLIVSTQLLTFDSALTLTDATHSS